MHQIELFIKYPNEVQNDILLNLVKSAKETFIGQKFDFKSINNYGDFSERVPVFSYEEFADKIDLARKEKITFFGLRKLSGLQNQVGRQMLKANSFQ